MLEKLESNGLKVFVVWTPAFPGDNREKAEKSMSLVTDQRAIHFWDGTRKLGDRYKEVLNLPSGIKTAWDVYFAFRADSEWKETPPKPEVWMHQLRVPGMDYSKFLNPEEFRSGVQRLLQNARLEDVKETGGTE